MRGSVQLRAFGQRDPLVEYKREGLKLFKEMEESVRAQVLDLVPRLEINMFAQSQKNNPTIELSAVAESGSTDNPVLGTDDVGRNDPCPCGSGKKYKNCGMKNTEEHKRLMQKK